MASRYILDTRLSVAQWIICNEAIRRGVIEPSDLNEGRRTMAEQWHFWNNQPPLAAYPSPWAPHIKKGFANHDIDCNSFNGAVTRLARFYESQDVDVSFCVGGEAWHMCVHSHAQVRAAAKRIRRRRDKAVLKKGERERAVRHLKRQLHAIKDRDTGKVYFQPNERTPREGWGLLFGEELEEAVKRFQRDHGLHADGVVGKLTDRKIDRAYARAQAQRDRPTGKARAENRKLLFKEGKL